GEAAGRPPRVGADLSARDSRRRDAEPAVLPRSSRGARRTLGRGSRGDAAGGDRPRQRRALRPAQHRQGRLRRRAQEVRGARRRLQRVSSRVRARSADDQAVSAVDPGAARPAARISHRPPVFHLAWLSVAMFLGMTLWFSATAANAAIVLEFDLTSGETAWLTMAVQGGFVVGTLISALLTLPDVVNPRRLFAVGCAVGAASNAGLVLAPNVLTLIALRVATGAALACVYPPGMKVAAGWFEQRRGTALGVLVGALTVGSAFPHLLAALSAAIPWRVLMLWASALAVSGGAIVWKFVGDGPYVTRSARFDPSAAATVFVDAPSRAAMFGYLGHMWELYAVWTWIATVTGSALAFVTIASGAIGSAAAGVYADRFGQARVAR